MLISAARSTAEVLDREGRRLSRQARAEALRANGHAVSNAKVSLLLRTLKGEAAEDASEIAELRRRVSAPATERLASRWPSGRGQWL